MKKTGSAFLMIVLAVLLCGCTAIQPAVKSVAPALPSDPAGEYAKLSAQEDASAIRSLVDTLLAGGAYTDAGAIVTQEHKKGRMYEYTLLCTMFEGHEEAVDMQVWDALYASTSARYEKAAAYTLNDRMALMRSYHRILHKHFSNEADAMEHALSFKTGCADDDGKLLESCGIAGQKKALVYINNNNARSISLSLTAVLPDELIPASPAETEYVVMLEYTARVVGYYSNGGDARRIALDISILHYPDKEVLYSYDTIYGTDPPQSITTAKGSMAGASGAHPKPADVAKVLASALQYIEALD